MNTTAEKLHREWTRFTPGQRLGRYFTYFILVAAIVWALRTVEVIPEFLYDAPEQMADLFRRMWPIDWSFYYQADEMGVHHALIETLHIATLGTIFAVIMAVPVSLMAARNITTLGQFSGLGAAVRRNLRPRPAGRNVRHCFPFHWFRRQTFG
jgi:phosphonate transport system permease protein